MDAPHKGEDVTLQATRCLRGQLTSISSARQELWLQNLESNESMGGREDVDALRLRAGKCFADPAWAVVNEHLRQHRYELATIHI